MLLFITIKRIYFYQKLPEELVHPSVESGKTGGVMDGTRICEDVILEVQQVSQLVLRKFVEFFCQSIGVEKCLPFENL